MAERKVVKTIELAAPVRFGDEIVEKLEFEPMRVEHLWNLSQKPSMGEIFTIAGLTCGQPPGVMKRLEMKDAAAVTEHVTEQLGPFLAIGGLLSEP